MTIVPVPYLYQVVSFLDNGQAFTVPQGEFWDVNITAWTGTTPPATGLTAVAYLPITAPLVTRWAGGVGGIGYAVLPPAGFSAFYTISKYRELPQDLNAYSKARR